MPVQFQGSRLAAWVLRAWGWRWVYHGFPARQGVAIVYPHTSNWDFPVAVLTKWSIGVQVRFWGKDSLFRIPVFGRWLRWLGGVPLDRSAPRGAVGEMVAQFERARQRDELFWLALSPEGTRKRTEGWRSGFYQLALGAQVPLALVKLDWGRRRFSVVDFYDLTGQVERDYAHMAQVFEGVKGFHEHQMGPILPWSPGQADESARLKP